MNFNFGEVLSRAWQIIWKHKVLWIFGILAGCSQGGTRFNSGSSSRGGNGFGTGPTNLPPRVEQFFLNIAQHVAVYIAIGIAIICIIWIIAIFLGTIGKIGLIRGAGQVEGGAEHLIFGQLFSESMPYFWRMFGLSLVVGLPFLIIVGGLVAGLVAFAIGMSRGSTASAYGFLGILPIFLGCLCFLILISIVVGWIVHQIERVIVLEDSPLLPAISRGWEIFRNNLGPIILMAIILGVIAFVAGIIIAIPVLVVVVPAAITFAIGNSQNYTPLIFAGICLCLYIPVSLLLNGILISYTETAWTLTYMRLTGKPASSDIVPPAPDSGTPPTPPSIDDGDKTIISSSHA
jgi:hypothetical protein